MRKLLLNVDVLPLGRIGDIVDVKDGYARNYLIPQGLATEPTPANIAKVEDDKKIVEAKRALALAETKKMADKINGVEITLVSKANEQGVLFGSIGPQEIADTLREEGYNIEPKNVVLPEHLKQVDKYEVTLTFASEVTSTIIVWVAPSKDASETNEEI
jgi:large subunit ribosomal protein L9